jgi:hypothetical protein
VVKKRVNLIKKTCSLNVEKLTTVQKMFVHELRPPANVRELTRAQTSGAWLKSRKTYKVRELSDATWLNLRKGITGNHVGREQNVLGEEQNSPWSIPMGGFKARLASTVARALAQKFCNFLCKSLWISYINSYKLGNFFSF